VPVVVRVWTRLTLFLRPRDNLEESLAINVFGVHRVTQAFLPLLQRGSLKKVANM
jgi:NAD(P)-dependent dehydrogenase (short-subunit alcohol dehydrogenase family)